MLCLQRGVVRASEVVDHKQRHTGHRDPLFWDQNNMQALCKPCHDGTKQQADVLGYAKDVGIDGWPLDPNHPARKK